MDISVEKIEFITTSIYPILNNTASPTYLIQSQGHNQPVGSILSGTNNTPQFNIIRVKISNVIVLPFLYQVASVYRNDIGILDVNDPYTVHLHDIDYVYIPPVQTSAVQLTPLYYIVNLPSINNLVNSYNYGLIARCKRMSSPVGYVSSLSRASMIFFDEAVFGNYDLTTATLIEGEFINTQTVMSNANPLSIIDIFASGTTSNYLNLKNTILVNKGTTLNKYSIFQDSGYQLLVNVYGYNISNVSDSEGSGSGTFLYASFYGNSLDVNAR